jgi:hypothetical protein
MNPVKHTKSTVSTKRSFNELAAKPTRRNSMKGSSPEHRANLISLSVIIAAAAIACPAQADTIPDRWVQARCDGPPGNEVEIFVAECGTCPEGTAHPGANFTQTDLEVANWGHWGWPLFGIVVVAGPTIVASGPVFIPDGTDYHVFGLATMLNVPDYTFTPFATVNVPYDVGYTGPDWNVATTMCAAVTGPCIDLCNDVPVPPFEDPEG